MFYRPSRANSAGFIATFLAVSTTLLSPASAAIVGENWNTQQPAGRGTNMPAAPVTVPVPGGEIHQTAGGGTPSMTTEQGTPISDDQNSLRVGPRGSQLLEDFVFRDKLTRFDHERIPERVVHARGYGVHGYFENYGSLADITKADLFQRAGEKTPVFVRFSTVAGNKGSFDLARDVRGFATKFYTKQGNWDLVGNNIPVFFIQDGMKFPDMVHAAKQEPDRDFPQAQTAHDNFWDFISLTPEAMHMVMWIMSDRAIPRSFRMMEGFGVHTFRLVNAQGKSTFVKFHWKPLQGMQSVMWNEAVKINGADPDFHRRDMWEAVTSKTPPQWELGMQLFDEDTARKLPFDMLDATKIIPEEIIPVRRVGKLVLNKMPDNFFNETEQVAFCTQNVVPGIDFTDDPLLQARNFSYLDTQLKRLGGPNFAQLPINAAVCPIHNFAQDGHMNMINPKGRVNYEPNSWGVGARENPAVGFTTPPILENAPKVRARAESFADHYSQARQFYISQTPIEQAHIQYALIFELSRCERADVRERMVSHLENIDKDLATAVANGLGMKALPPPAPAAKPTITNLPPSPELSIIANGPKTFAGRRLGILLTDGADAGVFNSLVAAARKEGTDVKIIAPKIGGATTSDGKLIPADFKIDGGPSVLFDAVAVVSSPAGTAQLSTEKTALDFVSDAFAHCKFVAFNADAKPLFDAAGIGNKLDEGFIPVASAADANNFITACRAVRLWAREPKVHMAPTP
jgi:catalase